MWLYSMDADTNLGTELQTHHKIISLTPNVKLWSGPVDLEDELAESELIMPLSKIWSAQQQM